MNVTNKLPEVRKRTSLPVSIPIHIYHQTLQMASANKGSNIISHQQMSKPIELMSDNKEQTSKHNDQSENQPKQANVTNKNQESATNKNQEIADKSIITDPSLGSADINETITCKCNNSELINLFFKFQNNFLKHVRQKNIIHVNKSTQTDNVPSLSHEGNANNKEFTATSKDTQTKKGADILNESKHFSQEFKDFLYELYSSTQRLFKENYSNNKRTFEYSQGTRRSFLNITNSLIDLITREEKATEDLSSGANIAADIANLEVHDNNRESSENIVPSVVNNNNNKETSHIQTQTAQNIIQQNDLPEAQEEHYDQRKQLNIDQSFIAEEYQNQNTQRYNLHTQALQAPQAPPVNYSNEFQYEHQQRSNILNTGLNFNNTVVNSQTAPIYTRAPRPQQQLFNNSGCVCYYENKPYIRANIYPSKINVRPTPYNQKPQKKKNCQQGVETAFQIQQGYYPINQEQFIQQTMANQQNLH